MSSIFMNWNKRPKEKCKKEEKQESWTQNGKVTPKITDMQVQLSCIHMMVCVF